MFSLPFRVDEFDITGPTNHTHHCFVFKPAAFNMSQLRNHLDGFGTNLAKVIARHTLMALDFLHSHAHIIHTDVKLDNILLSLDDESILARFANSLEKHAPKPKLDPTSSRKVYRSSALKDLGREGWGNPLLGDLGEARIVDEELEGGLQAPCMIGPPALRPPETLLEMKWSYAVDIWMLGCLVVGMVVDGLTFTPEEQGKPWSYGWHLAQIIALLGPAPADFLARSDASKQYWSDGGSNVDQKAQVAQVSWDTKLSRVQEPEKTILLDFLKGIFQWRPEDRKSAAELLRHTWLKPDEEETENKSATNSYADEEGAEEEIIVDKQTDVGRRR